jgi:hypothetical protein
MDRVPKFPDVSDILARKAAGRAQRATLSFAEKLKVLDEMRKRVEPIARARETNRRSDL